MPTSGPSPLSFQAARSFRWREKRVSFSTGSFYVSVNHRQHPARMFNRDLEAVEGSARRDAGRSALGPVVFSISYCNRRYFAQKEVGAMCRAGQGYPSF
jgi:hypothetical protein